MPRNRSSGWCVICGRRGPGCRAVRRRAASSPTVRMNCTGAALPPRLLLVTLPFPFIVWGADELRRYLVRRSDRRQHAAIAAGENG